MIFCKIEELNRYKGINKNLDTAISYILSHDLKDIPLGKIEIDGNNVYAFGVEMDTVDESKYALEGHLKYADMQIVLEGYERIGVSRKDMVKETSYDENKDFLLFSGPVENWVSLSPNTCLIVFPEDAHACGINNGKDEHIKKVVFKVALY